MAVWQALPASRRRTTDPAHQAPTAPAGAVELEAWGLQAENEEPQPQVVVAFGFLITNCAPSRPSW